MGRRRMDCKPSALDDKNLSETLMRRGLRIAFLIIDKIEDAKEAVQK